MKFFETLDDVHQHSKCLYTLPEVEQGLGRILSTIADDLSGKRPVILGVMRGALACMGYMLPRMPFYAEVDYVHASRYQAQLQTGNFMWVHEPHVSLKGRNVLLVDDILDQGVTLKAIAGRCYELGALDVKIAVLCKKIIPGFTPAIEADYVALEVPNAYVFGYGMDYEGGWRNAPGIYELL